MKRKTLQAPNESAAKKKTRSSAAGRSSRKSAASSNKIEVGFKHLLPDLEALYKEIHSFRQSNAEDAETRRGQHKYSLRCSAPSARLC